MSLSEISLRYDGLRMPCAEFVVAGRGGKERRKPLELESGLNSAAQAVDQNADLHRFKILRSGDRPGTEFQSGTLCGKEVRIRRINHLLRCQTQSANEGFPEFRKKVQRTA